MAANDPIGNVTAMQIKTENSGGETTTTINGRNVMINPAATYTQTDRFARALTRLTRETYQDTILITAISVTEILAE